MVKLWTGIDIIRLAMLKSELKTSGVRFMVKNENLLFLSGDLPYGEVWPEIWIAEESQLDEAKAVLRRITQLKDRRKPSSDVHENMRNNHHT